MYRYQRVLLHTFGATLAAVRWRVAMQESLYGPTGFFTAGAGAGRHFRTSVLASPGLAGAVRTLVSAVDEALDHPATLDVVDVGAGRGELLRALLAAAPSSLRTRLRPVGVELAPRPADLPSAIRWQRDPPRSVTGLVIATEWLDNVPLDVAAVDDAGVVRYVRVDESLDGSVSTEDSAWLRRWWPISVPGALAEIGLPRDVAWAGVVSTVERGLAVCVDYGHLSASRPLFGTLTGFREGRQVPPVPDGSCDLTAHVAMDSLAGPATMLLSQRDALRALGVSGTRPPLSLASTDPTGYVRALAAASEAAELTDPAGLGGHWWLLEPVGIDPQALMRWTGMPATREMTS